MFEFRCGGFRLGAWLRMHRKPVNMCLGFLALEIVVVAIGWLTERLRVVGNFRIQGSV